MIKSIIRIALLGVFLVNPAYAAMTIDRGVVYFNENFSARQDVEISNDGDDNLYVDIKMQEVIKAGTKEEQRVDIKDKRDPGLLVSPNKMIVPPHSRKTMRMVNLNKGLEADRIYRVTVTPVVSGVTANTTGVKILVAYEILTIIQPINGRHNILAYKEGEKVVFRNDGNTSALLMNGKQCPGDSATEDECFMLPAKRIYPGAQWEIELPTNDAVYFQISSGQGNEAKLFEF